VQLVVLGMGDAKYVNLFSWAEQQYPGRVAARFKMDLNLAHRIYAGVDMFLMPSQFEPCGLSQMISLRYGTLPIVRETGGLRDTVLSYNEQNGAGNGFSFFNYNAHDMLYVIRRAIFYYKQQPEIWKTLQTRAMSGDYSWSHSAEMYMSLYRDMLNPPAVKEEAPKAEEAPAKKPRTKKAKAEEPKAEEPKAEEPVKKPRGRKPKAEAVEAPKAEEPVKKPRGRKPKAEAVEAPKVEEPVKKPRAKKAKAEEAPAPEAPAKKRGCKPKAETK